MFNISVDEKENKNNKIKSNINLSRHKTNKYSNLIKNKINLFRDFKKYSKTSKNFYSYNNNKVIV